MSVHLLVPVWHFPECTFINRLIDLCLIKTFFLKQEEFSFAEEKFKALKRTEELGFPAMVMLLKFPVEVIYQ